MVRARHGASCPIGLATWRAVHSIATSYQVIASTIHALLWSATQHCTVARLCSRLRACFAGHDYTVCPHVI
jgi:hypothetical protein